MSVAATSIVASIEYHHFYLFCNFAARSGARSSSPSSCKQTWEYCETENKKCELGNDILYL
uniref:Bm13198 n=1 Tax=Brugia malayi TaxID=6279 RepID=A0A1I9GBF2_BRUMA|nr:Bm13198 [Brugia malayi]